MTPDRQKLRDLIDSPDYDPEYVDLGADVIGLIEEVERLREALESLKGEEVATIPEAPRWKATRIISYAVLNARIDKILKGEA